MNKISFRGKKIKILTDLNTFIYNISRYLLDNKFVLRYKTKDGFGFINLEATQIPYITNDQSCIIIAEKGYPYVIKFEIQIHEGGKKVTFSSEGDHFDSMQNLYQIINTFARKNSVIVP